MCFKMSVQALGMFVFSSISLMNFFISSLLRVSIIFVTYWMPFYSGSSGLGCSDVPTIRPLGSGGTILVFILLDMLLHCLLPSSSFNWWKWGQWLRGQLRFLWIFIWVYITWSNHFKSVTVNSHLLVLWFCLREPFSLSLLFWSVESIQGPSKEAFLSGTQVLLSSMVFGWCGGFSHYLHSRGLFSQNLSHLLSQLYMGGTVHKQSCLILQWWSSQGSGGLGCLMEKLQLCLHKHSWTSACLLHTERWSYCIQLNKLNFIG